MLHAHFVPISQQLKLQLCVAVAHLLTLRADKRIGPARNLPPKGVLGKSRHIRRRADDLSEIP
jgi:hypothetical protein